MSPIPAPWDGVLAIVVAVLAAGAALWAGLRGDPPPRRWWDDV